MIVQTCPIVCGTKRNDTEETVRKRNISKLLLAFQLMSLIAAVKSNEF